MSNKCRGSVQYTIRDMPMNIVTRFGVRKKHRKNYNCFCLFSKFIALDWGFPNLRPIISTQILFR